MDEATAALDNTTEREFMEALEAMAGHKTMIMIAHRLTTVKNCDCLYLIKNGAVADVGTYDLLISRNKEFKLIIFTDGNFKMVLKVNISYKNYFFFLCIKMFN